MQSVSTSHTHVCTFYCAVCPKFEISGLMRSFLVCVSSLGIIVAVRSENFPVSLGKFSEPTVRSQTEPYYTQIEQQYISNFNEHAKQNNDRSDDQQTDFRKKNSNVEESILRSSSSPDQTMSPSYKENHKTSLKL